MYLDFLMSKQQLELVNSAYMILHCITASEVRKTKARVLKLLILFIPCET